jgi:transcriptional regulator GlxA family with amidase domain
MTMLDAIGPNEVWGNSPYFDVVWASTEKTPIQNDQENFELHKLVPYTDIKHTDILLVPGGAGDHYVMQEEAVLDWIREINQQTELTTSVCTGALILAKSGILHEVSACTHWSCLDELASFGAIPVRKRFVHSGKFVSASGVSAGIDLALYLLQILVSKQHARDLRFGIEYFPNQYQVINSYSLPRIYLNKLAKRFHKVFQASRQKVIDKQRSD